MGLIKLLSTFVSAILARQGVDEFKAWTPKITQWFLRRALERLPKSQRKRYEEEWQSHLNDIPGEIGKLYDAFGFLFAARRMASIISGRQRFGIGASLWRKLEGIRRFTGEAFQATKRPTLLIGASLFALTVPTYVVLAFMSVVYHWPNPLKILLASLVQSLPPDHQARLSLATLKIVQSMPPAQLAAARALHSFSTANSAFSALVFFWWFYSFMRFLADRTRNPRFQPAPALDGARAHRKKALILRRSLDEATADIRIAPSLPTTAKSDSPPESKAEVTPESKPESRPESKPGESSPLELAKMGIDYVKHITTLASGAIALLATFARDLKQAHAGFLAKWGVAFLFCSIALGCLAMLSWLAYGRWGKPQMEPALKRFMIMCMYAFILGFVSLALFAIINIGNP